MEYPFKDLLPLDEVLAREGYYKDWTHLDPEVFYSLTQISNFIKTKGYGVDVRLLIAQLAEHFGLKTTQIVDLGNLLQAEHTSLKQQVQQAVAQVNADRNALETQFNQSVAQMEADKNAVIANATVDSEVILARGGKATLGQRLDETTAQLAQMETDISTPTGGKKYKIIACAIRNTGDGFQLISDNEHVPIGVSSILTDNSKITLNYDFTAKNVISLVVTPDEVMAQNGIFVGSSVGLSLSHIHVYKNYSVVGYITKSGGGSPVYTIDPALSRGVTGAVASNINTMNVTHDVCDIPNYVHDNVHSRLTKIEPYVVSYGNTTTSVRFRRKAKTFGASLKYNGTTFALTDNNGVSTAVWDSASSSLYITFSEGFDRMIPTISPYEDIGYTPKIYYYHPMNGILQIRFYDDNNTLITTPDTTMKVIVTANESTGYDIVPDDGVYIFEKQAIGKINPNDLTYAGSNFWIYGIMEVA